MLEIGVDLDEVLYDFVGAMRVWLMKEGHDHPMPPPQTWNMPEEWGLSRTQFMKAGRRGVDAGWLFARGKPLPRALVGMARLVPLGRIHLVTNRNFGPRTRENTLKWLKAWGIPYDSLHFVQNKAEEGPRCDVYVDDRPRNYELLEEAGMRPYYMDHAWNRGLPGRRVNDLIEFADEVEKLAYALER